MTESTTHLSTHPAATDPGIPDAATGDDESFRRRSAALGDRTRLAIYRRIAAHEVPVGVADLVDTFELNHNTVRQHLARLLDAGLIDRVPEPPRGPGRPRVRYRLTPEAAAGWNAEGPYERLSLLLVEVAATGASPLEVGRAAGRDMAVAVDDAEDAVEAFTAAIAAQGFAPRVRTDQPDRGGLESALVLEHCPFASAAEANAGVVCALHRGMVEGLAERVGGLGVTEFSAKEPRAAGCAVRVRPSASVPGTSEAAEEDTRATARNVGP